MLLVERVDEVVMCKKWTKLSNTMQQNDDQPLVGCMYQRFDTLTTEQSKGSHHLESLASKFLLLEEKTREIAMVDEEERRRDKGKIKK